MGIISLHNLSTIYPYIINQSVILFSLSLVSILFFGARLLDPNKLDKEIKRQINDIKPLKSDDVPGDFREFLKYYNLLEDVIIKFAFTMVFGKEECLNDRGSNQPKMQQALKVLLNGEVVTQKLCEEINKLRKYRNGLVHGVEFSVTQNDCNRVSRIYNAINNAFTTYSNNQYNSQSWRDAIDQIYNLTNSYDVE